MAHHHRELARETPCRSKLWTLISLVLKTQAIDDAYRTVGSCDDGETADEGKKIIAELGQLKYEVQHDRALTYVSLLPTQPHADMDAQPQQTGRSATMDIPMWPATTRSSSSSATSPG
jgi:hypothetical protein